MAEDDRVSRLEQRVEQIGSVARDAKAGLTGHEDICAPRYQGIQDKMDEHKDRFRRLEILILAAIIVIGGGRDALELVLPILRGGS